MHDRQPVVLEPAVYDAWLDPQHRWPGKGSAFADLDAELQFRRVSRTVNSVKNQGDDCIEPTKSWL